MATQVSLNDGAVASAGALAIQTNGTTQAVSISTGQVATFAQNPILTSGTINGVAYLNGSKVLTTGSALVFDGTNLGVGVTPKSWASGFQAIQLSGLACWNVDGAVAGSATYFGNNVYRDSADSRWEYIASGDNATQYLQASGQHIWRTAPSGTAGNAITFTQAMTLDASGNLLVGTTSGYGGNTRLNLLSSTNAIVANIYNSGSTSTTKLANIIQRVSSNASNADVNINFTDNVSNNYFFGGNNGGAYVMANTNGVRLSNGGTSWASDSDERLKDIIEPIINAAEKVSSLRAVIGKYKTDEEGVRRTFLIAQDVQAVLPEAVSTAPSQEVLSNSI